MTSILIIAVAVLITFLVKKNIYASALIGSAVFAIYIIMSRGIAINSFFYQKNLIYYFELAVFFIFILGMNYINENTRFTNAKHQIIEITNKFLVDKNIKILFLALLSLLMAPTPFFNLIILIFAAIFLNFSSVNMIIIPFIFSTLSTIIYYIGKTTGLNNEITITYGLIIVGIYYMVAYILYLVENNRYDEFHLKRNIIDFGFTALLALTNLITFLIMQNIVGLYRAVIIGLVVSIIAGRILVARFHVLVNTDKELDDEVKISHLKPIAKTGTPYLVLILATLLEIFLYVLVIKFNFYGILIFTIVNVLLVWKLKKRKVEINTKRLMRFIFVYCLIVITFLLTTTLYQSQDGQNSFLLDMFYEIINNKSIAIAFIENVMTFTILSPFTYLNILPLNSAVIPEEISKIILIQYELIVYIQVSFGFITYFIVNFIFTIKKNHRFQIMGFLILINIIAQLLILLIMQGVI